MSSWTQNIALFNLEMWRSSTKPIHCMFPWNKFTISTVKQRMKKSILWICIFLSIVTFMASMIQSIWIKISSILAFSLCQTVWMILLSMHLPHQQSFCTSFVRNLQNPNCSRGPRHTHTACHHQRIHSQMIFSLAPIPTETTSSHLLVLHALINSRAHNIIL